MINKCCFYCKKNTNVLLIYLSVVYSAPIPHIKSDNWHVKRNSKEIPIRRSITFAQTCWWCLVAMAYRLYDHTSSSLNLVFLARLLDALLDLDRYATRGCPSAGTAEAPHGASNRAPWFPCSATHPAEGSSACAGSAAAVPWRRLGPGPDEEIIGLEAPIRAKTARGLRSAAVVHGGAGERSVRP